MKARGLALVLSGLVIGSLAVVLALAYPRLFPDDVRRWGLAALGALASGFVLTGLASLASRRSEERAA